MNHGEESVLGIDFGGTKVALRVERGDGSVLDDRLLIAHNEEASSVLNRTMDAAEALVRAVGSVSAVGVSTPGVVHDDRVDLAPNVVGWTDLSLSSRLLDALGVRTLVVENDVKAAAYAETRLGALRDVANGLYVNLGTGIAIAPVLDGVVLRGAHDAAGEIGYGVVGVHPDWSGAGAPLEEYAGGGGLERRIVDAGLAESVADLVSGVHAGDIAATEVWNDAIDELARHLITAILTTDPSRIVIGGGMVRAGSALIDRLSQRFASALPYSPDVVVSHFGTGAALSGAILLARSHIDPSA